MQQTWLPLRLVRLRSLLWASYQIRKIAVCACAGNAGNVSPHRRFRRKPLVSDPGMHHGTCVTHVPWCMSGSLTCGGGENVPGIPGACAPAILRIWQEAHGACWVDCVLSSLHVVVTLIIQQPSTMPLIPSIDSSFCCGHYSLEYRETYSEYHCFMT